MKRLSLRPGVGQERIRDQAFATRDDNGKVVWKVMVNERIIASRTFTTQTEAMIALVEEQLKARRAKRLLARGKVHINVDKS